MYLWALSKIVGTKSSVGTPFSSCESGGYQERANTPNRKDQKEKKTWTQKQEWLQVFFKKKKRGGGAQWELKF